MSLSPEDTVDCTDRSQRSATAIELLVATSPRYVGLSGKCVNNERNANWVHIQRPGPQTGFRYALASFGRDLPTYYTRSKPYVHHSLACRSPDAGNDSEQERELGGDIRFDEASTILRPIVASNAGWSMRISKNYLTHSSN
jgi:hypothetical protein